MRRRMRALLRGCAIMMNVRIITSGETQWGMGKGVGMAGMVVCDVACVGMACWVGVACVGVKLGGRRPLSGREVGFSGREVGLLGGREVAVE